MTIHEIKQLLIAHSPFIVEKSGQELTFTANDIVVNGLHLGEYYIEETENVFNIITLNNSNGTLFENYQFALKKFGVSKQTVLNFNNDKALKHGRAGVLNDFINLFPKDKNLGE